MDELYQRDHVLDNKYRIISVLGKGGMGVVYRVEDVHLHRELALKTVDRRGIDAASIRRFQAEARAAYSMNHPNIVSVNDFGIFSDGTPYLAMQIVEGKTISDILKNRIFNENEAIPIFLQVCSGLRHAHESGVVHRDIKSSNIMLLNDRQTGTDGSVKILDFGIAKLTQHDGGEVQALTRTGEIFGSPLYMSPEQCSGTGIDHRTDVYSLGCVLFESLTGTPPFVGDNALSTMLMHQTQEVPSLREASLGKSFSEGMEQIVQRMLAKNSDKRYQTISEVQKDLLALTGVKDSSTTRQNFTQNQTSKAVLDKSFISLSRTAFGASILIVAATISLLTASAITLYSATKQLKPTVEYKAVPEQRNVPPSQAWFGQGIRDKIVRFKMTYLADAQSLDDLTKYPDVQSLDLESVLISPKTLAAVGKWHLLFLTLKNCEINNVEPLLKIDTLQDLSVQEATVTKRDLQNIAKMRCLHNINLWHCKMPADQMKELFNSTSLKTISLPLDEQGEPYSKQIVQDLERRMPHCSFFQHGTPAQKPLVEREAESIGDPIARLKKQIELSRKLSNKLSKTADYERELGRQLITTAKEEALQHREEAVRICRQNHDDADLVVALVQAGDLARDLHDVKKSDQYRLEAFDLAKRNYYWDEAGIIVLGGQVMETTFKTDSKKFFETADFVIDLGRRFPSVATSAVAQIMDTAGLHCLIHGDNAKASKYFDEECEFMKPFADKSVLFHQIYAHALASRSRTPRIQQKEYLLAAIEETERMQLPEEAGLLEQYNDSCHLLSNIYAAEEHNVAKALEYDQKAMNAVVKMRAKPQLHPDSKIRERDSSNELYVRLQQAGKIDEAAQIKEKYGSLWVKK
ncbi:MAG TPA: serine/threonine-protein kinase [Drouetiella sp.]